VGEAIIRSAKEQRFITIDSTFDLPEAMPQK
jgi:hypothetical protein